jgi:hypothetical protein
MIRFDGATIQPARDDDRLRVQLGRVKRLMADGHWRTLNDIALAVGAPEASVSARLRDLRKQKFGGYIVEREFVSRGLWKYRVVQGNPKPSP